MATRAMDSTARTLTSVATQETIPAVEMHFARTQLAATTAFAKKASLATGGRAKI